jgi:hypothetical protein
MADIPFKRIGFFLYVNKAAVFPGTKAAITQGAFCFALGDYRMKNYAHMAKRWGSSIKLLLLCSCPLYEGSSIRFVPSLSRGNLYKHLR